MLLKPHSTIDLITNSSSEVYADVTNITITHLKNLFNEILKISNSPHTLEELFTIKLTFQTDNGITIVGNTMEELKEKLKLLGIDTSEIEHGNNPDRVLVLIEPLKNGPEVENLQQILNHFPFGAWDIYEYYNG